MAQLTQIHLAHLPLEISIFASLFTSVTNAPFLRQQLLDGNTDFEYAFLDARSMISTTHILAAVFRATHDATQHRLKSRNVHSEIVFSLSSNNNIATSFRTFGITDSTTSLIAIKVLGVPATPTMTSDEQSTSSSSTTTTTTQVPAPRPAQQILTQEDIEKHLTTHVHGTPRPFTDAELAPLTDLSAVRKAYKLPAVGTSANVNGGGGGKKRPRAGDVNGSSSSASSVGAHKNEKTETAESERRELEIAALGMMALKGS